MQISIITHRPEDFTAFAAALAEKGAQTSLVATGQAALDQARQAPPTLAVVDEALPDMAAFALVSQLLQVNAFIHTAVATKLSPEAFHEAGEGLGILAALPMQPSATDAHTLLANLKALV
ncbi:hypothetical protein GTA51_12470 [Desulfovibrio aerotolerans]|uniref:Response regulator n=1 Tax=Solidesulfovibrio aerotolerans TaxID=295255 RepID=A0A7C9IVJ3_9BACT|nr:hypothetical protein [Solidesulfovibrio aerotolerans]MYL83943.1 hypothetical protein [Solidesulfovibrio aerotolerans]